MMPPDYFWLFSMTAWPHPSDIKKSFTLSPLLTTGMAQKTAAKKWDANHCKYKNFRNVCTALKLLFEWVIKKETDNFKKVPRGVSSGVQGAQFCSECICQGNLSFFLTFIISMILIIYNFYLTLHTVLWRNLCW